MNRSGPLPRGVADASLRNGDELERLIGMRGVPRARGLLERGALRAVVRVPQHDAVRIATRDRDEQQCCEGFHRRTSVAPSNTWTACGSSHTFTVSPGRGAEPASVRTVSGPG